MKELYYVNIQIYNKHGELVNKRFAFETLDEMRNLDFNKVVDEAETYGQEEGMLLEELFDSEEKVEFNKEDII